MAIIDDILLGDDNLSGIGGVGGAIVRAIDEWNALDPGGRPTLAAHLGLTDDEFATWGGPSTRVVNRVTRTTLGDAMALQTIIQARI